MRSWTRSAAPRGLISYDTVARRDAKTKGEHEPFKLVRSRTALYAGLIGLVSAIMLVAFLNRTTLEFSVLRDRTAMFVKLSDGGIRNGYTIKILNKQHEPRTFTLGLTGLPGGEVRVLGQSGNDAGKIIVPTDNLRELRVFVSVDPRNAAKLATRSTEFRFVVTDMVSGQAIGRATTFQSPLGGDRSRQ